MLVHGLTGFLCGLGGWTFMEYVIHRPLGHLPRGKTLISREHLRHHQDILYFSPVPLKIRGAVPVLAILGGATTLALDPAFALGFVVALAVGWTAYEVLHQSIHVRGPRGWYGRWAAKNHLYHHFGRPNRNFGVTTPLWDFVFGTHDRVERVSMRARDSADIPWLAGVFESSMPAPRHLRDYEIRRAD